MYFKQVEEIACKLKTCTQRVCKDGEAWETDEDGNITLVRDARGRQKWRVGNEYAVSPGRGKRGMMVCWGAGAPVLSCPENAAELNAHIRSGCEFLRIRILKIERVRLQTMDERVAVAEGVADRAAYITLWRSINDGPLVGWDANPLVWRLWFEVAR